MDNNIFKVIVLVVVNIHFIGLVIILVKINLLNTQYQEYLIIIYLEFHLQVQISVDLLVIQTVIYAQDGIT